MAQLPDVVCWIKVIDKSTGKALSDSGFIRGPGEAIVRYVLVNDSDEPVGPLWVGGSLGRNGVKVTAGGQSNVVPAQQVTLQPRQLWKQEFSVFESSGSVEYIAELFADIGNFINEEDETNNLAHRSFRIVTSP
jgi:hypothetical protein